MRARLPISASRFSSALAPAETPITQIRPPVASAFRFSAQVGRAHQLEDHVERAVLGEALGRDRPRRPSAATCSRSSSRRTVAVTRAPAARASWIAAVPTPPAPPCTSRRSPGRSPACVKSASWAVVKTSGSPPAAGQSSAVGHGHQLALVHDRQLGLGAAADDRHHAVARPRSARRPARARRPRRRAPCPGMSCGEPGGAG